MKLCYSLFNNSIKSPKQSLVKGRLSSALLILLLITSAQAQPLIYKLGPGDQINIQVYDEADLSFQVRLNDSGVITYPFIGEIQTSSLSTTQLENIIKEKLITGEFLVRPEVTVNIIEYRPFYIDGEVANPGSYPFEPGLTLRKAISIAGGFTERASRSKISVVSRKDTESEGIQVSEPDVELLDSPINPDDIITVEQRFF